MSFTLTYDGTTQTFAAWGIERINLTQRSQARGELKLTVRTVDANANPIFEYGEEVTIWQGATKRFTGWVTSLPVYASERMEYHSYTISDGWWWLEQIIFQDVSGPFYAESDTEATTPLWPMCSMFTIGNSGPVLNVGGTWSAKNIGEIVTSAVSYATGRGAPIACSGVFLENYSFLEDARDISCADLIRRALNWSPSATTWWDYSAATPDLRCDIRSGIDDVSVALDGTIAQSWELVPRYDMQVGQVSLYIIRQRQRADGTQYKSIAWEGPNGATAEAGDIVASIMMGTDEDGNEETVPPNIATNLLSELSTLQWEGKVTCVQDECTFFVRPGNALNLTGAKAHASWATMRATVQQVDYDLVTGRTVISFGPPGHLSPQDMIAILNSAKKNRPPDNPPNPGGGPGGGGGGGPGTPAKPYELELCDGTTINVLLANPAIPPPS